VNRNYTYNVAGELITQVDAKGQTTSYTDDNLNRVIGATRAGITNAMAATACAPPAARWLVPPFDPVRVWLDTGAPAGPFEEYAMTLGSILLLVLILLLAGVMLNWDRISRWSYWSQAGLGLVVFGTLLLLLMVASDDLSGREIQFGSGH